MGGGFAATIAIYNCWGVILDVMLLLYLLLCDLKLFMVIRE